MSKDYFSTAPHPRPWNRGRMFFLNTEGHLTPALKRQQELEEKKSWIVCSLGENTCRDTGETCSVDIAIVQQFFIE